MRYIMKGGVWKNSQDQILKAAIMKYGLNQWSRISSLLQRKSAKQCKQRWYEWLDPSIKKTQWTRAQDQKLLQLSRVFPSQWRTIAPFVGRTPTQSYQRYEKLLDLAQGKTNKQSEDLKKLRPGEIDPNPETKPARLDAIDMDQDQKEMLAEVRVRLANTKGKKAKRKQRQKIIQQARRLAQLQKIRELQMAGVQNVPTAKQIKRMKQKKDIDYNKEIPFQRNPAQFKYKLQEHQAIKHLSFAETITLQTLQGKRRDVQEQLQRKLDKRRMKKFRQRDLKTALLFKNDFEKPAAFPINLVDPNLTERDLQNMKKFNIQTPLNTQQMNQTPFGMTPQNKILLSARINYKLNHQQTPMSQQYEAGIEQLNMLKKLEKQQGQKSQIRSIDRAISERMKTPSNNEWQEDNVKLKNLFKNLKRPENNIEFEIPELDQQDQAEQLIDAEVQEIKKRQQQKIQQQKFLQLRSQVLKRNLPRPVKIPEEIRRNQDQINALIHAEMLSLIYSDAINYPLPEMELPSKQIPYKSELSLQQLQQAKQDIQIEVQDMIKDLTLQKYQQAKHFIKLDYSNKQIIIVTKKMTESEILQAQINNYKLNLDKYKSQLKHGDNYQKKVKKILAGYEKIIKNKINQINQSSHQLAKLQQQKRIRQDIFIHERHSIKNRMQQLQCFEKLIYNSI